MPIYEYRCEQCGHELDVIQKFSDARLSECPDCGESTLKKLLSAPSFRLKGSGWYETDFKKDNRRNIHDSGDGAKPGGESKSEKKASCDSKDSNGSKKAASGGASAKKDTSSG